MRVHFLYTCSFILIMIKKKYPHVYIHSHDFLIYYSSAFSSFPLKIERERMREKEKREQTASHEKYITVTRYWCPAAAPQRAGRREGGEPRVRERAPNFLQPPRFYIPAAGVSSKKRKNSTKSVRKN